MLHASNMDWGATDSGAQRKSTKGNDKFIRALARFRAESDRPLAVVMLDRGPDRELARAMVGDLGLDDVVEWRGSMRNDELYAAMAGADLIVDQFDVGAMGGIAWEAVTMGRPLLTYLAPDTAALVHDELPPILNARAEDEIVARLHEAMTPGRLDGLSAALARWAEPRGAEGYLPRYLAYARLATRGRVDLR